MLIIFLDKRLKLITELLFICSIVIYRHNYYNVVSDATIWRNDILELMFSCC